MKNYARDSSTMRIALFMPSFRGGGAERVMVNLANEFGNLRIDGTLPQVDLLVASPEGPYRTAVGSHVSVIDLGVARTAAAIVPLTRYLVKQRPAALLSTMTNANVIACLAHRLSGRKARLVIREVNVINEARSVAEKLLMSLASRVYGDAHALVCPSPAVHGSFSALLSERQPASMPIIWNPAITDSFQQMKAMSAEPAIDLPANSQLILGVGRLHWSKGFEGLIDAMAAVAEKRNVSLVILGQGEDKAKLLQRAAMLGVGDRVYLPGFVDNPFAWMTRADLFVLNSHYEGLPNALIQALSCGCQVVATRLPGSTDVLLDHGRFGQLVAVGDVPALSEAIEHSLDVPQSDEVAAWCEQFESSEIAQHYARVLFPDSSITA